MNYFALPEHSISAEQLPKDIEYFGFLEEAGLIVHVVKRPILAQLHKDIKIVLGEAFDWENSN
jgi:hypothetical protein